MEPQPIFTRDFKYLSVQKNLSVESALQLPHERRKKRADVEIFRPILAKFARARTLQKKLQRV